MAIETKSIGTTARDYSTITAWEAAINNTTYASAGTDVVGECYNDSDFDEHTTIDATATNVDSITLTSAIADRHTGIANTGVRILRTGGYAFIFNVPSGYDNAYTLEWIEVDLNGNGGPCVTTNGSQYGNVPIVRNNILHDQDGDDSFHGFIRAQARDILIYNNICYNNTRGTSIDVRGLYIDGDRTSGGCFNNTVYNVEQTGAGDVFGMQVLTDSANHSNKNNIVVNTTTTGGGTALDIKMAGSNIDDDYNMSSDASADDNGAANAVISITTANQFVSTTLGAEDLRLKSGSDAIDAGTDLGTTYAIDINGEDRDTVTTWDIGAHEYELPASGDPTITPAAQSLTLTQPAPTISIVQNVTVTPSAQSLTLTQPTPSISIIENATATPSAQSLTLTLPAPTIDITGNVTVTPAAQSLTLVQPAPTVDITGSATVTPSTQTLTLSLPAPTISIVNNATVTPATQTLTLTPNAPIISIIEDVTISPAAQSLTLSLPAPTIDIISGTTVTPSEQTLTLTQPAPTVTIVQSVTVTPAVQSLTLTQQTPSINMGGILENSFELTLFIDQEKSFDLAIDQDIEFIMEF